jgi:hypothetical protein
MKYRYSCVCVYVCVIVCVCVCVYRGMTHSPPCMWPTSSTPLTLPMRSVFSFLDFSFCFFFLAPHASNEVSVLANPYFITT